MHRAFWAPKPHKRFILYFITGHFIVVFYIHYQENSQTLLSGIAHKNVKKCIIGITMPKISVKRLKVSLKTPFWPRLSINWG